MKAAVIQFDIQGGDVTGNRAKAAHYLEEAAAQGAELVLLPELWNCGYALEQLPETAESYRGESVKMLQKLAKEHQMFIIGGSIGEKKDGKFYNTSVAVDQNGEIVQKYRKVHLFRMGLEEHKYFSAGDEWTFVQTPWLNVGMMICYDLRFPEYSRNLVLRGSQLLTVPAQWPASRERDWRVFCQARAIENQCFLMAANRTGIDGGLKYGGASLIVDAWGHIVADALDRSGAFVAELDLSQIDPANQKIDVFGDRRLLLDEIDDSQI